MGHFISFMLGMFAGSGLLFFLLLRKADDEN